MSIIVTYCLSDCSGCRLVDHFKARLRWPTEAQAHHSRDQNLLQADKGTQVCTAAQTSCNRLDTRDAAEVKHACLCCCPTMHTCFACHASLTWCSLRCTTCFALLNINSLACWGNLRSATMHVSWACVERAPLMPCARVAPTPQMDNGQSRSCHKNRCFFRVQTLLALGLVTVFDVGITVVQR